MSTTGIVNAVIARSLGVNEDDIKSDSSLADDLEADSLDMVELVMALEEELDVRISDEDCENWKKAGDIQEHFESLS